MEVHHWRDTVVFQYEPSKDGDVQASKLANFDGTLLVDSEHRYNRHKYNLSAAELRPAAYEQTLAS